MITLHFSTLLPFFYACGCLLFTEIHWSEETQYPSTSDQEISNFGASLLNDSSTAVSEEEPESPHSRGIIFFDESQWSHQTGAHWELYTATDYQPLREGNYKVKITYLYPSSGLGTQLRIGSSVCKKNLPHAAEPTSIIYGEVTLSPQLPIRPGLATEAKGDDLKILELALIPIPASQLKITDLPCSLKAENAITWSTHLSFQSKANAITHWQNSMDYASWTLPKTSAQSAELTFHYQLQSPTPIQALLKIGSYTQSITLPADSTFFQSPTPIPLTAGNELSLQLAPSSSAQPHFLLQSLELKPQ
jgi:hypothetical protein